MSPVRRGIAAFPTNTDQSSFERKAVAWRDLVGFEEVLTKLSTMSDNSITEDLRSFVSEREWAQFHTEENLAKSISIEAAELLECYQWGSEAPADRVRLELADVLTYCFLLADSLGVDPHDIVREKLEITRSKYPVDKAKGRSTKYDRL